MPAKSISSAIPLISNSFRYAVDCCPKCGSRNIRGPFDTKVLATFLFTRSWCCLDCWWDREMQMKDDVAEAQKKHQRDEEKKRKYREQARRT